MQGIQEHRQAGKAATERHRAPGTQATAASIKAGGGWEALDTGHRDRTEPPALEAVDDGQPPAGETVKPKTEPPERRESG